MNRWEKRKFLKFFVSIELALIGLTYFDAAVSDVLFIDSIIIPILGTIFILYIPGIIILRLLKTYEFNNTETILYSIGLSISFLMFIGLIINQTFLLINIQKPISSDILLFSICLLLSVAAAYIYIYELEPPNSCLINISKLVNRPVFFLFLIPFLSIFGTYLENYYHQNFLLKLLLILIVFLSIAIALDLIIPEELYPLSVFIFSLSLLLHRSLISEYIVGSDISIELFFSNMVIENSQWNPALPHVLDSMLSITMLAPIISEITKLSVTSIFKIIYPLIFSLVSLGIYEITRRQINKKFAFYSAFFFMSVAPFYSIMLHAARQQIALFFLVILVLVLTSTNMQKSISSLFLIIFTLSLIVSHYGTTYLFLFSLLLYFLISYFLKMLADNTSKKRINPIEIAGLSSTYIIFAIVSALSWYIYTANSQNFLTVVYIGRDLTNILVSDLFNTNQVESLSLITKKRALLHSITLYLNLISQGFIFIGILSSFSFCRAKFNILYSILAYVFFTICFISLIIPHISNNLGIDRTYMIALIFLAPFFSVGFVISIRVMARMLKINLQKWHCDFPALALSLFLASFLLFNSGLIYDLANDNEPTSISLNPDIKHPRWIYTDNEAYGMRWLVDKSGMDFLVYLGDYRNFLFYQFAKEYSDLAKVKLFDSSTSYLPKNSYTFLDPTNLLDNEIGSSSLGTAGLLQTYSYFNQSNLSVLLITHNNIYNNGLVKIYD